MDTISRESNSSFAPIAGIIAGVLAIILAIVALVKVSTLTKKLASVEETANGLSSQISDAKSAADKASSNVNSLASQVQQAFNQVTSQITALSATIEQMKTQPKVTKSAAGAADRAPGPGGDYTIKAGDTLGKIAKASGVTLEALQAANPGVDSTKLKIGQTINLPKN